MAVQEHKQLLTADDLLAMPEGDVKRELVRGELIEMSPTGRPHSKLSYHTARLIDRNSQAYELGEISVESGGYLLFRNPDTVRAPDVAFTSNERLAGTNEEGYYTVAPDLAIEIVSPKDSADEVLAKVAEYLEAGTRLVVVMHPKLRRITVHTSESSYTLDINGVLDLSLVIPDLTIPVRDIFALQKK